MIDNTVQQIMITPEIIQVLVAGLIQIEEIVTTSKAKGQIIMVETHVDQDKEGQEREGEEGDFGQGLLQGVYLGICLGTETLVTTIIEVIIEAGDGVKVVVVDIVREPHSGQGDLEHHHRPEQELHQDLVEQGGDKLKNEMF